MRSILRSVWMILLVFVGFVVWKPASVGAFSLPTSAHRSKRPLLLHKSDHRRQPLLRPPATTLSRSTSILQATPFHVLSSVVATTSRRLLLLAATTALLWIFRRRFLAHPRIHALLWPNTRPDPNFKEPLPPGDLGCPFLGHNLFQGNTRQGPEVFYSKHSAQLGHPSIWKFYSFGAPVVALTGSELVTKVQNLEFHQLTSMGRNATKNQTSDAIFAANNLMFEKSKTRHRYLRELVGSAMTPTALQHMVPTLESMAENYVRQILESAKAGQSVCMDQVAQAYAYEIVQTLLLGLPKDWQDKDEFQKQLKLWLQGMYSFWVNTRVFKKYTRAYKARNYLQATIRQQIERIRNEGMSNTSTLSNMMAATVSSETQKEDTTNGMHQQLSTEELVENTMLLVAAGTENSASTLTLLVTLLSRHPRVLKKLALEQDEWISTQNYEMKYDQLQSLPYLDAVVKEALRMGAITGGFPRRVTETLVVQGYQIPKGWYVFGNYRLSHQLDRVARVDDHDSHMKIDTGFVPERWLQVETTPVDYMPFGAGPRYCLGANLATLEIKLLLAILARNVKRMELVKEGEIEWNPSTMVPKPLDGAQVWIEPREGTSVTSSKFVEVAEKTKGG